MNILAQLRISGLQERIRWLEKWRREAAPKLATQDRTVSLMATPQGRAAARKRADFWRNVEGRLHFQVRQARAELRRRMN